MGLNRSRGRALRRASAGSGTEMQITVAERYRRLLITSSAQIFIFANLVFDLSYFYAIVADCHTRVRYLKLCDPKIDSSRAFDGLPMGRQMLASKNAPIHSDASQHVIRYPDTRGR
jgi:hypothetical protein